ncbi:MAG: hypothetical protein IPM23_08030 [Candidatus Melainabacteria bacterium]|nr:hypothetical protein [Candidatus Melainabacteria bacterium]
MSELAYQQFDQVERDTQAASFNAADSLAGYRTARELPRSSRDSQSALAKFPPADSLLSQIAEKGKKEEIPGHHHGDKPLPAPGSAANTGERPGQQPGKPGSEPNIGESSREGKDVRNSLNDRSGLEFALTIMNSLGPKSHLQEGAEFPGTVANRDRIG